MKPSENFPLGPRTLRPRKQRTYGWILLTLLAGCGGDEGPPRYDISGKVTFGGRPVPAGEVTFEPDVVQGNSGPQSRAPIVNGVYQTQAGCVAGPVLVRVVGFGELPTTARDTIAPFRLPLFTPYETPLRVPAHDLTFDIEVPARPGQNADSR